LLGRKKKKKKVHSGKCYRILAEEYGPYLAKIQKKKKYGRHSLQVADLQKYKPTLSFISPQKLLPPSITYACRPPRSSSRRRLPATPPPADESDARHLHHQQPSTTVLNGPNATTHDPPSRGVNFLKGFFHLILT
jgi:hypothetical protein